MNIFERLERIYNDIDGSYTSKETMFRSKGHHKKESEYFQKRQLNNQAYFLFMFTKLEDRIRNLSDKLVDEKMITLTDWKIRRAWEIINKQKQNDSLHFMNRVALLTPKGGADYNLINQYYTQRNNIGHGGTFTITISMPTVVSDMKNLHKKLKQ